MFLQNKTRNECPLIVHVIYKTDLKAIISDSLFDFALMLNVYDWPSLDSQINMTFYGIL